MPILASVFWSETKLRYDPNLRLRCPYCGHVFPRQDKGRCPACQQVLLIPPTLREHAAAMRDRCIRISRDRRERLFRMQRGGNLLATRRMRRTLAIVAFVVLGVLLPMDYMLRKPGDPALVLTHEARTRQTLGVLRTELECFRRDCGRYPTDAEGLWALVLNPGLTNWCSSYVSISHTIRKQTLSQATLQTRPPSQCKTLRSIRAGSLQMVLVGQGLE